MIEDYKQLGEVNSPDSEENQIMTMEELLVEHELMPQLKVGEVVTGIVASKRTNEILIDIGAKSEGIVDAKDLSKLSPEELSKIRVGDKLYVYVVRMNEYDDEYISLSLSQAKAQQDWDRAEELYEKGEIIHGTVIGHNKGGLLIDFGYVRGFVPGSQLINNQSDNRPTRWDQMIDEELKLKIIEVNRNRNRLILSERAANEELRKRKLDFLKELNEGDVISGKVTNLTNFGAFVDIGGINGLVHLSELAWTRISHPSEVVSENQEVEVHVLNVDLEQERVALSLKQLQPEPWSNVFDYYHINQVVDAVITKLTDYGAFARIDNRIDGLIHISEISDENVKHPREILAEDQEVQVKIIHIDPERRRMGLSIKQVYDTTIEETQDEPADDEIAETQL